jgi:TrmH family RNA methyltransferase
MNRKALGNLVIVLDEPQDLVNIAGVVRAMKNMGLRRLRLVRPVEFDTWRITGIAHRSEDLVDSTEVVDTLDDAVQDCTMVVGTTARARTALRNYGRPRDWADRIIERARTGRVAVVFGREDKGLSNAALDRCDGAIVIPTDPGYKSLNLAHASLLVAYEIFLAAEGESRPLPRGKRFTRPATRGEVEEMIDALAKGLERIDFFKARSPETVMRTFRTVFAKAEPNSQEARLLKAVGFEIAYYTNRSPSPIVLSTPRGDPGGESS